MTRNEVNAGFERARQLVRDHRLSGLAFCSAYTEAIDAWLTDVFASASSSSGVTNAALVAVGGHGRGELCPQSDLDLMLLLPDRLDSAVAERFAEAMWYPLWDTRVPVGHSARTVGDALGLARSDLETATAFMTARHLAGDSALTDRLSDGFVDLRRRRAQRWLRQLVADASARHAAAGEVAHELEPELKEGAGGLRDLHLMLWARELGAEVDDGSLAAARRDYDTVLDIRVALHRVTGRPGNRLVLQDQDAVSKLLGDDDPFVTLHRLAMAARDLAWQAREVADHALDTRNSRRVMARVDGRTRILRDDPDLAGTVELSSRFVALTPEPPVAQSVLRIAAVAAERSVAIEPDTLERLRSAPELDAPWPDESRRLLVRLLMSGAGCIAVIETLDRAELWTRLIPEWEGSRCRPQRNPYHRWNVDRHLTETVARSAALVGTVSRPDLLVIGALLHDIGKGVPGQGLDHAEVGAEMAARVVARIGLDDQDANTIVAMVRDHLLLPDMATRRDLDDPATIDAVAERVESVSRLRLLAALAEADGCATGPSAWGRWKSELVRNLVERVTVRLSAGEIAPEARGAQASAPEVEALVSAGELGLAAEADRASIVWPASATMFASVAGVLATMGIEIISADVSSPEGMGMATVWVRTHSGDPPDWDRVLAQLAAAQRGRLALRSRLAERAATYSARQVPGSIVEPRVRFESATDATIIEVATHDSVGLLFRLASALAEMQLDVRRAAVATLGPDVVDTFYVTQLDGSRVDDAEQRRELDRALRYAADA